MRARPSWAIVVPTIGRATLQTLLDTLAQPCLAEGGDDPPDDFVLVNDRPGERLDVIIPGELQGRTRVVSGPGKGPAAAATSAGGPCAPIGLCSSTMTSCLLLAGSVLWRVTSISQPTSQEFRHAVPWR